MARNRKINRYAFRPARPAQHGFHLMAKPAGPACNLRCRYCFYSEKKRFFRESNTWRMPDEVLEAYTQDYIASQPGPSVVFEWQGGEPGLVGVDFFKHALDLQKKYSRGKQMFLVDSRVAWGNVQVGYFVIGER